jgi:hypothetical protein
VRILLTIEKEALMNKRFKVFCFAFCGGVLLLTGCSKKAAPAPAAANPTPDTNVAASASTPAPAAPAASPGNTAPGPVPVPATATPIAGDANSALAQLTRELHRTMIGRKLSGSFDEFVAISHVQVPPPPAGKKYAIDKHWHVVLVNN